MLTGPDIPETDTEERDLVSGAGGAAGGLVPSDPFPQRDGGAEVPSGSAQVLRQD